MKRGLQSVTGKIRNGGSRRMRRKSQRGDQVDGERVIGKALTACASPALETGDGWWSVPMDTLTVRAG